MEGDIAATLIKFVLKKDKHVSKDGNTDGFNGHFLP